MAQLLLAFQAGSLGRDQAQDDEFFLWDFFERRETARTGIVVFQQETLGLCLTKKLGADGFVSSL